MRSSCCPCVCMCVCVLLGNGSVKVPLLLLGNGVFCAVLVVSKESMGLVLPRNSCFHLRTGIFPISEKTELFRNDEQSPETQ
jgi:hypothetical protein